MLQEYSPFSSQEKQISVTKSSELHLLLRSRLVDGNARWLGLIGIVPLAAALFSVCPLYSLVGLSTCFLAVKK